MKKIRGVKALTLSPSGEVQSSDNEESRNNERGLYGDEEEEEKRWRWKNRREERDIERWVCDKEGRAEI